MVGMIVNAKHSKSEKISNFVTINDFLEIVHNIPTGVNQFHAFLSLNSQNMARKTLKCHLRKFFYILTEYFITDDVWYDEYVYKPSLLSKEKFSKHCYKVRRGSWEKMQQFWKHGY